MDLRKNFLVYGLGKSGISTTTAILNAGGTVYIGDDIAYEKSPIEQAILFKIDTDPFPNVDAVITAPGIPHKYPKPHRIYQLGSQHDISVMCDIELFYRTYSKDKNAKFIGITGTNGKSTVTALTTHILKQAGVNAISGGNIGTAMFDCPPPRESIVYVLEISSYQADLCQEFSPDVVCFLNLTPDHIDRHGHMEGYYQAKKRIFSHLNLKGKGYVSGQEGILDAWSQKIYDWITSCEANISLTPEQQDAIKKLISDNPYLKGQHNYLNALTSCAMALGVGCTDFSGLANYVGLPHRAEFVRKLDGIIFVNDSKATNADATKPALHAYNNIYWLAGGVPKEEGITPLLLQDTVRVKQAFFYGQAGERFYGDAVKHGLVASLHTDLAEALRCAYVLAKDDESLEKTILLSPSCASFDGFKNFEHRGDFFKDQVKALS